jgi:hypothetical protein
MKHFTSYYANFGNIPKDNMCVGISRTCPEYFNSNNIPNFLFTKNNILAPSEDLLYRFKNNELSEEDYKKIYITDLFSRLQTEMHENDFVSWLDKVDNWFEHECYNKWNGLVFLCYEKPIDFCHRHLVRRLMTNIYGINCEEFGCKPYQVWGYTEEKQKSASRELF